MLEAPADQRRLAGGGDGEERGAAGERRLGHRVGAVAVAVGLHHRAEPRLTELGPQPFAVGAHGAEVDPGDRPLHGYSPSRSSTTAASASARVTMPASRPSSSTTGRWL